MPFIYIESKERWLYDVVLSITVYSLRGNRVFDAVKRTGVSIMQQSTDLRQILTTVYISDLNDTLMYICT